MSRFKSISGLSEIRHLPRLGKIHLGVRSKAQSGAEYPKEVDYFVVPPEVAAVYGERPKLLDVLFPVDDRETVFPCSYKLYGKGSGLLCSGDGERCERVNRATGEIEDLPCPAPDECEFCQDKSGRPACRRVANLMVVLYKVSLGGVYQIDTGSWCSIVGIQSGLEYIRQVAGRIVGVPLILVRVPQEITHEGKKSVHHILQVRLPSFAEMQKLIPEATGVRRLLAAALSLPEPTGIEEDLYPKALVESIKEPEAPQAQSVPVAGAIVHAEPEPEYQAEGEPEPEPEADDPGPARVPCPRCKGSRRIRPGVACPTCKGTGAIAVAASGAAPVKPAAKDERPTAQNVERGAATFEF